MLELGAKDVAQAGQVEDVQRGVIEKLLRKRAFGPVGFLAFLGQDDAEMVFKQGREAEAGQIEQLRAHHRVEEAVCVETAEVIEEAQVEVAAMHDQVFGREARPKAVELERSHQVDEEDLPAGHDLQEADAGAVAK